jgi:hypothetical protein
MLGCKGRKSLDEQNGKNSEGESTPQKASGLEGKRESDGGKQKGKREEWRGKKR